jgi:zinc transport system substrate-binding protein
MVGLMKKLILYFLVLFSLVMCSDRQGPNETPVATTDAKATLSVYTVNYPLQYFAERIGGPHVKVSFPAPAGVDPAFWVPTTGQLADYQGADLILLNGASYAGWLSHVSLPVSRMTDTSASFVDRYIMATGQVTHSHGDAGEHEHGDVAFTTWLDPLQAIKQAAAIRDALIRLRPDDAADFQQRYVTLENDLHNLDQEFSAAILALASKALIFSHPVYQYFIRRYDIDGHQLHWEPDEIPNSDQWQELGQLTALQPAEFMLWEGEPAAESVAGLKQRGLDSTVVDPCGNRPETGDYLAVMRDNIVNLKRAFKSKNGSH